MSPPTLSKQGSVMPSLNPSKLVQSLQALHATPELLSRPEYAEVAVWIQKVAAVGVKAKGATSAKKPAAAAPSDEADSARAPLASS